MCGRFTLKTPESTIGTLFPELQLHAMTPRYNIAPTQNVVSVRAPVDGGNSIESVNLRWGLVPSWAKDLKMGASMINARSETVGEKPAFKRAVESQRCLIPADGYYEWQKLGKSKHPYYVTKASEDSDGFCMAGIWDSWTGAHSGETLQTCSVLTTAANGKLSAVHDRMPVVIQPKDFEVWLTAEYQQIVEHHHFYQPAPDGYFQITPVEKTVNKVSNDSPDCIKPLVNPPPVETERFLFDI